MEAPPNLWPRIVLVPSIGNGAGGPSAAASRIGIEMRDCTVQRDILAVSDFGVRVLNRRGHKVAQIKHLGINCSCHEWLVPLVTTTVDTQILFGAVWIRQNNPLYSN